MQHLLLILIFIGTSLSAPVNANKVYKWTDENGQVHFSSQPPRGVGGDEYKLRVDRASTPPPKTTTANSSENDGEVKTLTSEAESVSNISDEQSQKYCSQAKDAKAKLSENFNRRFKQDDGSFRPLTDKERADMIKRANEAITAYCK